MKKFFTLVIALLACVCTISAAVTIDGLAYNLNTTKLTAELTYRGYTPYEYNYSGDITIPGTVTYENKTYYVTSIGDDAFNQCNNLTSVVIPNTIESIGIAAFYGCPGLTSLKLPYGLEIIRGGAFQACANLTSINLPNSVIEVDGSAFFYTGLTSPVYNAHIFAYLPPSYSGSYIIPYDIESIAPAAFMYCKDLTAIELPNSIKKIGQNAFANCTNLTSIVCRAITPPTLGSSAFDTVDKSIPVYVPEESIDAYKAANQWKDFTNIQSIEHIIAYGTCGGSLSWSLSKDYTLTITGEGAMFEFNWDSPWYDYRDLIRSVFVGEGVTTIGSTAFRDCRHMQQCSLPSTLQSIGNEAFCFCFQLISVDIPQSCTSISGWGAFNLVPNLNIQDENIAKESGARSLNGYVDGLFVYDNSEKRSLRACSSAATGEITLDDAIERIEYMAFAQCEDITHINFGSNLKYIGEWALDGCRGLDSLQFQEGLTEIATHGFGNCFGLRYVSLPNSLITLGDFAIGNCPDLRVIRLGESLTSVGYQIFDYCQSIDTIYASMPTPPVLDETAFAATDLSKVICLVPNQSVSLYKNALVWKQMNIKSIDAPEPIIIASGTCGDNLTWKLTSDSTLTIEGSGDMSWDEYIAPWDGYNQYIRYVSLPDGLTSIGRSAFFGYRLTSIDIPNSVTSIGSFAFQECTGLTSVSIPSSVINIDSYAFFHVPNIVYSGKATGSPWGARSLNGYVDGYMIYSDETKTRLLACSSTATGEIIIPNSVTYIGMAFYRCKSITSIIIPNSVESIGISAFNGCSSITSIKIPNSVNSIGGFAFNDCSRLKDIYATCGDLDKVKQLLDNDSRVKYEPLPYTITVKAINGNVHVPDCTDDGTMQITVTPNDGYHFVQWSDGNTDNPRIIELIQDTTLFAEIVVNTSGKCGDYLTWTLTDNELTIIGSGAMWDDQPWIAYRESIVNVNLPQGLTYIGNQAFESFTALTNISIPNTVTSVGYNTFYNCNNITSFEGPVVAFNSLYSEKVQSLTLNSGVLNDYNHLAPLSEVLERLDLRGADCAALPKRALYDFYLLRELVLPANVETIGYMAVANCKNLQRITIPASVTAIAQSAFEDCRSLSDLTFAEGSKLETIGSWAFYNCHNLPKIEIPDGVTEIGDAAFYGCVYAESLKLPASIHSLGDNAFALCSKLNRMDVDAVEPPTIVAKTFYEVSRKAPVYVPDESVNLYKADPLWGEMNIVGQHESPTGIDTITDNPSPVTHKIIKDNQILILRGEKVYTVTGQEVR